MIPVFALISVSEHLLPYSLSRPALSPSQSYIAELTCQQVQPPKEMKLFSLNPNSKFLNTDLRFSRVLSLRPKQSRFYKMAAKSLPLYMGQGEVSVGPQRKS